MDLGAQDLLQTSGEAVDDIFWSLFFFRMKISKKISSGVRESQVKVVPADGKIKQGRARVGQPALRWDGKMGGNRETWWTKRADKGLGGPKRERNEHKRGKGRRKIWQSVPLVRGTRMGRYFVA